MSLLSSFWNWTNSIPIVNVTLILPWKMNSNFLLCQGFIKQSSWSSWNFVLSQFEIHWSHVQYRMKSTFDIHLFSIYLTVVAGHRRKQTEPPPDVPNIVQFSCISVWCAVVISLFLILLQFSLHHHHHMYFLCHFCPCYLLCKKKRCNLT